MKEEAKRKILSLIVVPFCAYVAGENKAYVQLIAAHITQRIPVTSTDSLPSPNQYVLHI